jgi:hypothetical protein
VIVVGILLLCAAGTLSGLLIADNLAAQATYEPRLVGHLLPAIDPVAIFCAGLGLGFVMCLGIWVAASAVRRRHDNQWDDAIDTFIPGLWRAP